MAKKRKSRKELLKKPDEFLSTSAKSIQWASQNLKLIGIGIGGIALALALFVGLRFYSNHAENAASASLELCKGKYASAEAKDGPLMAYQQVSQDFQEFLDKHGSKKIGQLGKIHYANICYKAGQYDQAADLFLQSQSRLSSDSSLTAFVMAGLAYSYEALKKYPEAIAAFERIRSAPLPLLKDEALYHLGNLYAHTGENEKSQQMYQQLLKEYPESIYIKIVKEIQGA